MPYNKPLKAEVVRIAREMRREGLVVGSMGNVSAREGPHVYITPSGLAYEHLMPNDVVVLDGEGSLIEGTNNPSSEHRVHLTIYAARSDVKAVVHTHSVHATAWSFFNRPLELKTEELEFFVGGEVSVAAYATSGTSELAQNAVAALGDRQAALLSRHGVIGVGNTLEDALNVCLIVERQAHMAWLLRR